MKNEKNLLTAPSTKIRGLLTLEKAKKYNIGIFEHIDFRTYCALKGKTTSYDSDYVILTKTNQWVFPYDEPFTHQIIIDTDKRQLRGSLYSENLIYAGSDFYLKPLTKEKLGQIFPDQESIEEYKKLIKSFAQENYNAYYETKNKIQEEKLIVDRLIPSTKMPNELNEERGKEVLEYLNSMQERINEQLSNKLKDDSKSIIYTLKK